MKTVIIESPYAGDIEKHVAYARAALADSLRRGEAPLASHLLYTQALDDLQPEERSLGIAAGLVWAEFADVTAVYSDLGISEGMAHGIRHAVRAHRPVDYRSLPGWVAA